ncbi:MAG: glutathione S-transferase family protein [Gammaproteobacteria bacterium]
MIKLFQYPALWHLPNPSPFCMKLQTYLRMAKIPFEIVTILDPRKAPKGKLPYIEDDNRIISDSDFIIDYLKQKFNDSLDSTLTPLQKGQALVVQRMLEEHFYWVFVYSRWIDEVNWPTIKKAFFGKMPFLLRCFIPEMLRKNVKRTLFAQGIGRHSREDIYQLGLKDLKALAVILNDQLFLMGSEPTSIDACCFAFLANVLGTPGVSPLKDFVQAERSFVDYCARMNERFYS